MEKDEWNEMDRPTYKNTLRWSVSVADIVLGEYALDLIPFDDDVLSMEISSSFKETYLDGDFSSLYNVARAIMKLQSLYGVIPNIKAKGKTAKIVYDMITKMRQQTG